MITVDYNQNKPLILNIEHVDCEPSYMNDQWKVLAGDVITYTKNLGEPKRIFLVLERIEDNQ